MSTCPFCYDPLPPTISEEEQAFVYGCSNCLNAFVVRSTGADVETQPIEGVRDIRQEVAPGSVMGSILETLNKAMDELPVLPEVPQRILSLVHDPLASMKDVAAIINEDAAISVKILRLANSAFYASPHEIKDLNTACTRLGLKVIANTVHAIANGNLYRTGHREFRSLMERLWRHAVATAHCTDELATHLRQPLGSSPFVAGLVHEIGKAVLLDIITLKYKGNVGRLRESEELLVAVIDRFYRLVGLHVVQRWEMSPEFTVTTFCHGHPEWSPNEAWLPLTHMVSLGATAASYVGYTLLKEQEAPSVADHPSAEFLGMTEGEVEEFCASVPRRLDPLIEIVGAL